MVLNLLKFAVLCILTMTGNCLDGVAGSQVFCGTFVHSYKISNDSGAVCFNYHDNWSSWYDANRICGEEGKFLVKIINWSMDNFITEAVTEITGSFRGLWINGAYNKDRRLYKFFNGGNMTYFNFETSLVGTTWRWRLPRGADRCIFKGERGWAERDCRLSAPFVCQPAEKTTSIQLVNEQTKEQTTSLARKTTSIQVVNEQTKEQTTSPALITTMNLLTTEDTTVETTSTSTGKSTGPTKTNRNRYKNPNQRIFKAQKMVGWRMNPKLVLKGMYKAVPSVVSCVRFCSAKPECVLVNFCENGKDCFYYDNYYTAVNGGVTSEVGCSLYYDMDVLKNE